MRDRLKFRCAVAQSAQGIIPTADAENLRDGMFRPSDLLEWNGDGYTISGRISDLINVGGRKVNPGEVERVLRLSPRVRDVVVLGIPANARGRRLLPVSRARQPRTNCASFASATFPPGRCQGDGFSWTKFR